MTSPTEADIYKNGAEESNICDILQSVVINHWDPANQTFKPDDTALSIRRDVRGRLFPLSQWTKKRKADSRDETQSAEAGQVVRSTEHPAPIRDPTTTSRELTRTVMRTYGWSIKYFKDIPELLQGLRDAISGMSAHEMQSKWLYADQSLRRTSYSLL